MEDNKQQDLNNEIGKLVADIVSEIFDAMFAETRVDSFKGGINKTGSLVLPRPKVNYLKRYKNRDWHKWPKKGKDKLNELTKTLN